MKMMLQTKCSPKARLGLSNATAKRPKAPQWSHKDPQSTAPRPHGPAKQKEELLTTKALMQPKEPQGAPHDPSRTPDLAHEHLRANPRPEATPKSAHSNRETPEATQRRRPIIQNGNTEYITTTQTGDNGNDTNDDNEHTNNNNNRTTNNNHNNTASLLHGPGEFAYAIKYQM
jgi:hypothetical protein